MKEREQVVIGVAAAWLAAAGCGHAGMLGELTVGQQAEVGAGRQVVIEEAVKGEPWPRISVYQTIAAKPEEVAAVFFDYGRASSYVPGIIKSEVSKRVSASEFEVDYGLDVPVVADEYYTVRNRLSRVAGGGYVIDWKLVRALQTKASVGEFRIEPDGAGALVRYRILTTPGAAVARLLRGRAVATVKDTVAAIGKETVRRRAGDPAGLQQQVAALRAALGGG